MKGPREALSFHAEPQDIHADGWLALLELIERAAADRTVTFVPLADLPEYQIQQIRALPASIASLTSVRQFVMYGSHLLRVPPEIGQMTSLEMFEPYTSYSLHWLPYEITRCPALRGLTISRRALYGNEKAPASFPALPDDARTTQGLDLANLPVARYGHAELRTCSVCDRPLESAGLYQGWTVRRIGADRVPLLVSACSATCRNAVCHAG